jgi:hypothetical protein
MDCFITNGVPNPMSLNLTRNSNDVKKRSIVWKTSDGAYIVTVPPDLFLHHEDDRLVFVDPDNPGAVMLKPRASTGEFKYTITPLSLELGIESTPEIIVNDEVLAAKSEPKPARNKPAKKAPVKKVVMKKTAIKTPPAEKAA